MMHVIIVGFSGAIAMNLTICIKQIGKQRRCQAVVIKAIYSVWKLFQKIKKHLNNSQ